MKKFWQDSSTWLLVITNLIIIIFATVQHWNFLTLMWIYWTQSVIIGLVNFVRMLLLKDFSTKGMIFGGKPVEKTTSSKIAMAFFFLFHYGGFQAMYVFFIFDAHDVFGKQFDPPELLPILIGAGFFLINHVYSFIRHFYELSRKQKLGDVMGIPYIRIVPMHIVIIFMAIVPSPLIIFLLLRTVADVTMHAVEHHNPQGTII